MIFFDFPNIKISALAAAVPDHYQHIIDYAGDFPEGEIAKFCETTGIQGRYISAGVGTTSSDLCVAAANEIFAKLDIDRNTIDGLIFLTQTPDYITPPTSCVIQYRLGLEHCGVAYDSNIGCTGFPYGIQMACANVMAGCNRVLLLVGDADTNRRPYSTKDGLLFGDCGMAMVLEKSDTASPPIQAGIHTIGSGYKALIAPYGMQRHAYSAVYEERGAEYVFGSEERKFEGAELFAHMDGADVFTFSIKDAPKAAKEFFQHFNCAPDEFDMISIHQADKLIVDNVVKRIKAPREKVLISFGHYGNTRGASTAINILDYAERENIYSGTKRILNLAFGIGLNIALAAFELDMSRCLPIIKTREVFDDGINSYTYF